MRKKEVLIDLGFDPADVEIAYQWSRIRKKGSYLLNLATITYLLLNALSPRVPGPASYLRLAPHVRLLHHLAVMLRLF